MEIYMGEISIKKPHTNSQTQQADMWPGHGQHILHQLYAILQGNMDAEATFIASSTVQSHSGLNITVYVCVYIYTHTNTHTHTYIYHQNHDDHIERPWQKQSHIINTHFEKTGWWVCTELNYQHRHSWCQVYIYMKEAHFFSCLTRGHHCD